MTPPRRETSPVMAYSVPTAFPVTREARAVTRVIPADGPSFGTAPQERECEDPVSPGSLFLWEQRFYQSQGNLDRLFHYISKLSGDEEISFSFHQLAFDKEDLAACGGPGKACNYTRLLFLRRVS